MCGIYFRYCRFENCTHDHPDIVDLEKIAHRGPDDRQVLTGEQYFSGFQRLSIRAHEEGEQPYISRGKISCFNGELYNEEKIRQLMLLPSLPPGDMQLLGEMLIQLGPGSISHAEGMFAGFVFDVESSSISVFRDRAGEKPLYIYMDQEHLCISSELQFGFIQNKINVTYAEIFQGFVDLRGSENLTIVKAATYIDIDLKRWTKTPNTYWKWNQYQKASSLGIGEALTAAVETRLVADTKVCTFLSGGIDSAVISQIASKSMGSELEAFTLKIDGRGYDESQLAQKTAKAIGIGINIVSKTFEDLAYDSLELLSQVDLPILDTSAILTYSLAKEVSKEYKVALTGDGGDELFLGYQLFKYYDYLELLRRRIPRFGAFALNQIIPLLFTQTDYLPIKMKFERLRFILEHPGIPSHISAISPVGGTELADFLSKDVSIRQDQKRFRSIDLATYYRNSILPEVYLLKTDRASMLNGLELRAPFLDSELIYFANREILMERKMGNKTFLRNYAKTFLPPDVLNSPKHGFSAPFGKIMEFLDEPHWNNYFPSELAKIASITWQNARVKGGNSANAAWCLLNITSMHDKFLFVPA